MIIKRMHLRFVFSTRAPKGNRRKTRLRVEAYNNTTKSHIQGFSNKEKIYLIKENTVKMYILYVIISAFFNSLILFNPFHFFDFPIPSYHPTRRFSLVLIPTFFLLTSDSFLPLSLSLSPLHCHHHSLQIHFLFFNLSFFFITLRAHALSCRLFSQNFLLTNV